MESTNTQNKPVPEARKKEPMGFGKTMLASAVGFIIGTVVLSVLSFFLFAAVMVSALSSASSDSTPIVGKSFAVELNITGDVSEGKPNELISLMGDNTTTSLSDLLATIDHAKDDDRVKALYLHLGGSNLSWAQAEELATALGDFKLECDKPVITYGEAMSQPEYYLATCTQKICVHPSGIIDFRGMGAEVMFYKGLLDKLGVHMELIRPTSCAYKSAGEVYTRTDMSDANREQVHSYINSIWDYAVKVMATNRHMTVDQMNAVADNLSGYLPNDALEAGLVDTLCFAQDVKKLLKEQYLADKIVKAKRYAKAIEQEDKDYRIAVIYAEGDVVPGKGDGTRTAVYGDDIVKALADAAKDKKVKAIVLRVNSPGGAVTASESMTHAVIEAKKEKPVIISMSGLAASAGYEISCFGTKIVAHPTTLTGSIGVFATIPEVGNLLRQKLGITTDTVKTNKNSTGLSLYRPLSNDARAMLQKNVEDFYITFTQRVADGRGLTREYVDSIARGRVWTGAQAKELGLVDTLGGLTLALHIAAEEAEVDYDKCKVKVFPEEKGLWELMMQKMNEDEEEKINARLNSLIPFYSDLVRWSNMEPLQARLPFAIKIN
ncbi:MAG: signal peptide peptidase SppA [Bacteroidales bacterium]|nr:signal peptide peptidase SppA [Bacteroidales bacterium]